MDDQEEKVETDNDEFITVDNLDYYVPMSDEERQMYENNSLRAQEDRY